MIPNVKKQKYYRSQLRSNLDKPDYENDTLGPSTALHIPKQVMAVEQLACDLRHFHEAEETHAAHNT